jgi:DNA-binding NtrC family response regulator
MKLVHLEDEGPLREVLGSVLMMLDDEVELVQFFNGDDAWAYIEANLDNICVYILDVRVPGKLDGMAIAEHIRKAGSKRPIVINSAYYKPDKSILNELELEWMPKPLHILSFEQ